MSTSRRTILGLLAAAPVAVPVAIKAAATAPRFHGTLAEGMSLRAAELVGEDCHGGFVLSPAQSDKFLRAIEQSEARLPSLRILMRSPSLWDAPNRLYGVSINEEGEAI